VAVVTEEAGPERVPELVEARWWEGRAQGKVLCRLCPRYCLIGENQAGFCYVRKNVGGKLWTLAYARPTGLQIDPIEKKPLNHFFPGASTLSMGTAGCNLGCKFCQNWSTSKARADQVSSLFAPPSKVVAVAREHGCEAIAYTYNEPTIWAEYVIDVSRQAHRQGLKNVMVTCGYITAEALGEVYEFIDAANVDLKAFTEDFYRRLTLSHLDPVLDTIKALCRRGVWVEVTNLVIPGLNDSPEETQQLARWLYDNVGPDVPLHFTAFHPAFRLTDRPRTPEATLARARRIALEVGMRYVYEGNVHSAASNTYCPACGQLVIGRDWHRVTEYRLQNGRCPCGYAIAGHFPN